MTEESTDTTAEQNMEDETEDEYRTNVENTPYYDEEPSDSLRELIELKGDGVVFRDPGDRETGLDILAEGSVVWSTLLIDYYYGRPVVYLRDENGETVHAFALPTGEDPELRTLTFNNQSFEENKEIVEESIPYEL